MHGFTMIDWQAEDLMTMTQASKEIPGRPALSTLWRWANKGCRGIKLDTLMVGGTRYTSTRAVQQFFEAITRASAETPDGDAGQSRQRVIAYAELECQRHGI
jgi:hypothetical protein